MVGRLPEGGDRQRQMPVLRLALRETLGAPAPT